MRRVVLLLCISLAIIVGLCGCNNKTTSKKFEKAGLTITLTTDFYEKEHVEYTAYYTSSKMIVLTVKESFDSFEQVGQDAKTMSVEDYARFVISTYQDFYNSASDISNENGMVSFIYENDTLEKDYKFIWYGFKAMDAFWGVQFGCAKSDFDALQSEMLEYVKTVEIEKFIAETPNDSSSENSNENTNDSSEDKLEPKPVEKAFAFQENEDGQGYTVVGLGTVTDVHIVIPSEYLGLPVTAIKSRAFSMNTKIKSVEIPDTITTIGSLAFLGCTGLENVSLPKTITKIQTKTFSGCKSLRWIIIPDSVEWIESMAFFGCYSLNHLTLGKNVKVLEWDAFGACYTLVEVQNKSGISLQLGGNLTEYSRYIYGEDEQSKLSMDDNGYIIFSDNDKKVLVGHPSNIKRVVVPNGITELQTGVFTTKEVTSVVLPDSLEDIGDYAFNSCYELTTVNIPNGVSVIPVQAFHGCKALKEIVLPSTIESIEDQAFWGCKQLKELFLPNSVTSIGREAFKGCDSLECVSIPDSVVTIGVSAFNGCESLNIVQWSIAENKDISFSNGIFRDCPNLQYNVFDNAYYLGDLVNPYEVLIKAKTQDIISCTIADNTNIIYGEAFANCAQLIKIEIPNSVVAIGASAFNNCVKLMEVCNKSSLEIVKGESSFGGVAKYAWNVYSQQTDEKISEVNGYYIYNEADKKILISYPMGEKNIVIPDGIQEVGERAFADNATIETVQISNSISVIGDAAFMNCASLISVYIPDSVTEIGIGAFYKCISLKSIRMPSGITEIKESTFDGCASLEFISIPEKVTIIAFGAFQFCISLKEVELGPLVSIIGNFAFDSCPLQLVYYKGTATSLFGIPSNVIYYYSETEPALNNGGTSYNGNYWRYVRGVPTIWEWSKGN